LNRRSIASVGIILCEQTLGEGWSANVPTRKSWGVLFWEEGLLSGSHQPPLASPRGAPHFKKCAILSRGPTQHGVSYRESRWPKELSGPPPCTFCSSGAKERCGYGRLLLWWRSYGKGCAISSKARAAFFLFTSRLRLSQLTKFNCRNQLTKPYHSNYSSFD
jgi:hypothetical protein